MATQLTINSSSGSAAIQPMNAAASVALPLASPLLRVESVQGQGDDAVTISAAANAALAAATPTYPFTGLSEAQLQAINSQVQDELSAAHDAAGLAANAAQLPNPATPERIASANSATAFIQGGGTQPNPFAGLSRTDLSEIIYDQSGTYTVNEREAAMSQQGTNDSNFLLAASNQSIATGDRRYIYTALTQLEQHMTPVEKAVPDDLAALATTPQQLAGFLNEANSEHGGPLTTLFDYPGGWTS